LEVVLKDWDDSLFKNCFWKLHLH